MSISHLYKSIIVNKSLVLIGGKVYGDEALEEKSDIIQPSYFGTAGEVIITKDETLFLKVSFSDSNLLRFGKAHFGKRNSKVAYPYSSSALDRFDSSIS